MITTQYPNQTTYILGISAFYHDSAVALIRNGVVIAAAQEERFTRKKHDNNFPHNALRYCLEEAGIKLSDLSFIVFYDKPFTKFDRIVETYLAVAPRGFRMFLASAPVWLREKLFLKSLLKKELKSYTNSSSLLPKLLFTTHHQAHAASAFYPSPFDKAAILCLDGVGEWATTSAWVGEGNRLTPQWEIRFPHSLGLLYSAFTQYLGFKVNSGEYKVMGLAPYGTPRYHHLIIKELIDLKDDGTFRLNMEYFGYLGDLSMTNDAFHTLFGGPPRRSESALTQREMDIAASIQSVTEEIVLRLCRTLRKELNIEYLCLAGGVALNCVANGKIVREGIFKDIWVQPAAGDAGGALGAALAAWYEYLGKSRNIDSSNVKDGMHGTYLGPMFSDTEIERYLIKTGAEYTQFTDEMELATQVALLLKAGNVIGWFQGRMEFGPRALGNRSIIGDPTNRDMQSIMNLKIKFRESFRPFAPAVLAEDAGECFELKGKSPYMLVVAPVSTKYRISLGLDDEKKVGVEKLKVLRSKYPAITHVDYSARVQTVHRETNPRFHTLISAFKRETGVPLVVNTSFNVRGEPIVCTPEDAYRCFMRTNIDYLVLGNFVLAKSAQPTWEDSGDWKHEFELD